MHTPEIATLTQRVGEHTYIYSDTRSSPNSFVVVVNIPTTTAAPRQTFNDYDRALTEAVRVETEVVPLWEQYAELVERSRLVRDRLGGLIQ